MIKEFKIEQLKKTDMLELIDLFTQAFDINHPLIPALKIKPEATRKVIKASLDFFCNFKSYYLYGIRKDNKLICASLSLDSTIKPSIFSLIRFAIVLILTLGWHSREFKIIHKEGKKYKGKYLNLILLGTLPAYQKQGFGRKMLHFLQKKAKEEKYKGVILITNKDLPAFHFYLKEGYIIDKEFKVSGTTFCCMRLEFN